MINKKWSELVWVPLFVAIVSGIFLLFSEYNFFQQEETNNAPGDIMSVVNLGVDMSYLENKLGKPTQTTAANIKGAKYYTWRFNNLILTVFDSVKTISKVRFAKEIHFELNENNLTTFEIPNQMKPLFNEKSKFGQLTFESFSKSKISDFSTDLLDYVSGQFSCAVSIDLPIKSNCDENCPSIGYYFGSNNICSYFDSELPTKELIEKIKKDKITKIYVSLTPYDWSYWVPGEE